MEITQIRLQTIVDDLLRDNAPRELWWKIIHYPWRGDDSFEQSVHLQRPLRELQELLQEWDHERTVDGNEIRAYRAHAGVMERAMQRILDNKFGRDEVARILRDALEGKE